jgi:anti-sigma factor RsiW
MNEEIQQSPQNLPSTPTRTDEAKELEQVWTSRIRLAARATAFVSGSILVGTALFQALWAHDLVTASTLATVGGGLLTIALTGKQE